MGLQEMLPETAKALSAPLTKLIEVVAAGCGRVYEPTGIRRKARADGDALVIAEEARARASEVSLRAAQRLLDVEERRQRNIDAITGEAAAILPEHVSSDPVDVDWAARFFDECQDVGNEQMRSVWARLLAGEVSRPGSFSQRTLWVLKNVSVPEAQNFNTLAKHTFRGTAGRFYPLVGVTGDAHWDELGLDFMAFQRLEDAGLVTSHPLGIEQKNTTRMLFRTQSVSLMVTSGRPGSIPLGHVSLTAAGAELARICEWEVPASRVDAIEASIAAPFQVARVVVLEEFPDGRVTLGPSTDQAASGD
jgi:hypothetical protein